MGKGVGKAAETASSLGQSIASGIDSFGDKVDNALDSVGLDGLGAIANAGIDAFGHGLGGTVGSFGELADSVGDFASDPSIKGAMDVFSDFGKVAAVASNPVAAIGINAMKDAVTTSVVDKAMDDLSVNPQGMVDDTIDNALDTLGINDPTVRDFVEHNATRALNSSIRF